MTASSASYFSQLDSALLRMQRELMLKAALLLRRDGQVIGKHGSMDDNSVPQLAALLAGITAASESVAEASGHPGLAPKSTRLSLEFSSSGLYAIAVGSEHWLAAFYEDVLNPGQLRMKVRNFGNLLEAIESKEGFTMEPPGIHLGDKLTPRPKSPERLFENITDDEIEKLFGQP